MGDDATQRRGLDTWPWARLPAAPALPSGVVGQACQQAAQPTRHCFYNESLCARLHRLIQESGELLHIARRLHSGRPAAGRHDGAIQRAGKQGCLQGSPFCFGRSPLLCQAHRHCLAPSGPPGAQPCMQPDLGCGKLQVAVERLERRGQRLAARRERLSQQRSTVDGQAVEGVHADIDLRFEAKHRAALLVGAQHSRETGGPAAAPVSGLSQALAGMPAPHRRPASATLMFSTVTSLRARVLRICGRGIWAHAVLSVAVCCPDRSQSRWHAAGRHVFSAARPGAGHNPTPNLRLAEPPPMHRTTSHLEWQNLAGGVVKGHRLCIQHHTAGQAEQTERAHDGST